jgi:hypothetical protein
VQRPLQTFEADICPVTLGAMTVGTGSWQMTDTCHGSYHFLCMPKIDIKLDGSQNYLGSDRKALETGRKIGLHML